MNVWANRIWQTTMAVVLGPFTATWTIVALVSTIYMGNPKSFEVIAKTQETSKAREQRPAFVRLPIRVVGIADLLDLGLPPSLRRHQAYEVDKPLLPRAGDLGMLGVEKGGAAERAATGWVRILRTLRRSSNDSTSSWNWEILTTRARNGPASAACS